LPPAICGIFRGEQRFYFAAQFRVVGAEAVQQGGAFEDWGWVGLFEHGLYLLPALRGHWLKILCSKLGAEFHFRNPEDNVMDVLKQ